MSPWRVNCRLIPCMAKSVLNVELRKRMFRNTVKIFSLISFQRAIYVMVPALKKGHSLKTGEMNVFQWHDQTESRD